MRVQKMQTGMFETQTSQNPPPEWCLIWNQRRTKSIEHRQQSSREALAEIIEYCAEDGNPFSEATNAGA